MKLYIHSTAPSGPSSYSVLTARVVPEFVRMGHQVCVGTWYGLQGSPQKWPIFARNAKPGEPPIAHATILPSVNGAGYAMDTFEASYKAFGADVAISIMDVWVVPPNITRGLNFAPWCPIDHEPAPAPILQALSTAMYPMTFSRWGAEVLAKAGITARAVPCSANASLYTPGDKDEARKKLQIPEGVDFVVSMIAANKDPSDRKGFGEALQAFARFVEKHENAIMYIHTNWYGPVKIEAICERLGIKQKVARPDAYHYDMGMYAEEYLRNVYRASDVLLNPAKSEGFGLPILEAQQCGRPVILSDFSSTDELLFAGWKVAGQLDWSIGMDSWRLTVFVDSIVDALEEAYREKDNELLQRKARQGAIALDTERVAEEHWKPALADIEKLVCGTGSELKLVQF